ncbi:50S ribosomal protein L33 (macronuclear) [Tetrahymena thermophila SB210]|uniref:50S ribosomal protein L33 n=1 Tax=Tetrahymena thermophila (strain SB210) TaxID=312017 RepID=Q22L35_TETTS|nr:50S ribosomal protein L33 [Tetrahymena thermophila SB210]EAR85982.2 50S ribosomal protein L33 [Tetrahymena thermophila SB210]6Z1P_AE Chain AE, 50S ribosomal protein L33 [Tetrahymena thermophila SB210]|eukprot:XP_976577.2 50S ribosomal protein L33 [Tetrahymena thermophila SB210]
MAKNSILFKLVSSAGTGFFYLAKRNAKAEVIKKLSLRKFDPIINQYVVFNEAKLSSGKNRQSKK